MATTLALPAALAVLFQGPPVDPGGFHLLHYDTGALHALDLGTGVVRLVGLTGLPDGGALARAPDGRLYALTTPGGALWTVDPADAQARLVGPLGPGPVFEGGLAIAPDGRAWGLNAKSSLDALLFTVDLATGAARVLGALGPGDYNGLAWRDDGRLIGLERVQNALVEIDPATLEVRTLAHLLPALGAAGGLTIHEGRGFFVTGGRPGSFGGTHELWDFDPFTGVHHWRAPLPDALDGVGVAGLSAWPDAGPVARAGPYGPR